MLSDGNMFTPRCHFNFIICAAVYSKRKLAQLSNKHSRAPAPTSSSPSSFQQLTYATEPYGRQRPLHLRKLPKPEKHTKRQATQHGCLPSFLDDGDKWIEIVYAEEKNILNLADQKPNSWTYNFIEVSGRNLESSQTRGFCMDFFNHREGDIVFYQVFLLSPLQNLYIYKRYKSSLSY
jgi:hypothetical protein